MNIKKIALGIGMIVYCGLPTYEIGMKVEQNEMLSKRVASEIDTNHDGTLSIQEVQRAYGEMGIDENAIFQTPYNRLTKDSIRYPFVKDLEKIVN